MAVHLTEVNLMTCTLIAVLNFQDTIIVPLPNANLEGVLLRARILVDKHATTVVVISERPSMDDGL